MTDPIGICYVEYSDSRDRPIFHHGLQCFFVDFFLRNFKQQIHFEAELSRDNVSAADIIVLSFCMGGAGLFPNYRRARKGCDQLVEMNIIFLPYPPALTILFLFRVVLP